MNWDTVDVAIANACVWAITHAGWLVAIGVALLAGTWLAPRRPEQQDGDYRPTHDDMAGLIWRADWERTQREAAEAELRRLQGRLRAVDDTVRCAELELGWDRP